MAFGDKRTPLKRKTALKAKTSLRTKTPLKGQKRHSKKSKPKKGSQTARAKKMARKRKLCEDYNLPLLPCSRWGTAKDPTRTDLLKGMAWTVFSKFIRERDVQKPCITCGLPLAPGDIQAGHYVPVGNSSIALWFREDNVHGEHPACNADFQGWHLVPMRKNMVALYGEEHVAALDALAGKKNTVKWEEQNYVDLIRKYL